MTNRIAAIALGATLIVTAPAAAHSQSSLQVVVTNVDHVLLRNMVGVSGSIAFLPTWMRFGGEYVRNSGNAVGVTCVGLVPPGIDCSPEPVTDKARMLSFIGEVAVPVMRSRRVDVDILVSGRVSQVKTDRHGLTTGRNANASEDMFGGYVGIETTWYPLPTKPIGLRISGAAGRMEERGGAQCADCADPIREGANLTRFALALTLRQSKQPR